jgi:hypothetical protein
VSHAAATDKTGFDRLRSRETSNAGVARCQHGDNERANTSMAAFFATTIDFARCAVENQNPATWFIQYA